MLADLHGELPRRGQYQSVQRFAGLGHNVARDLHVIYLFHAAYFCGDGQIDENCSFVSYMSVNLNGYI